jgi:hypothetical protein
VFLRTSARYYVFIRIRDHPKKTGHQPMAGGEVSNSLSNRHTFAVTGSNLAKQAITFIVTL